MPFQSEAQRRYLWANHPEIAKRWAHKYPGLAKKHLRERKTKHGKGPERSDSSNN